MALSQKEYEEIARRSIQAERTVTPMGPTVDLWPVSGEEEAYRIQHVRRQLLETEGKYKVVGAKMGGTSQAKMRYLGAVGQNPSYGILYDYMELQPGQDLVAAEHIQPKAEAEIAFVMKEDLYGDDITPAQVMEATDYVTAAIEIIDSRYLGFKFGLLDAICDNVSSSAFKLGEIRRSPHELDLRTVGARTRINGVYTGFGAGGAVMGHPARSVAYLVNALYKVGEKLSKGSIILSGAIVASHRIFQGDEVMVEFEGLGDVQFKVT